MITKSVLHYTILKHIIDKGFAPDVKELATLLNSSEAEVEKGLYDLQEYHGLVLHPNEAKIWVIHPFSLAPTNFLVESATGKWWGNCAWCSLGVAALLNEDVKIKTSIGAHGDPIEIAIKNGKIIQKNYYIHFPVPMKKAWDNVLYTCSTMLVFETEAQIDHWCQRHKIPKGDIQPLEKIWEFSKKWYGNHLNPEWLKWTMKEAKAMFIQHELTHEIWDMDENEGRF